MSCAFVPITCLLNIFLLADHALKKMIKVCGRDSYFSSFVVQSSQSSSSSSPSSKIQMASGIAVSFKVFS